MGRGVLALIAVIVWLLSATGSAQALRDGSRVTARAASRGHDRPRGGAAHDRTSRRSGAPAGPRDQGSSNWTRPDGTPPPTAPGADLFRAGPDTFAPGFDRPARPFRHLYHFGMGYGYMSGFYFPTLPMPAAEYPPAQRPDVEPLGYLRLEVRPGTAQVYVDGFYVGTVDDFNRSGPGRFLEAGPHRVEIRADGFDTITFDVRIVPNETITYRSDLAKSDDTPQAALPAPVRAAPKTLYVIPRCYAGDTPPRAEQLPPGCDPGKVRTVP